jgi:hypothetical protein
MMLEVGKLYRCSEYFLSLFPNKETAATASITTTRAAGRTAEAASTAAGGTAEAAAACAYWTRKLGKPVSFCDPQTPLLVLSVNEKYVEVLAGDRKVWIINDDWLKIKEIADDAA